MAKGKYDFSKAIQWENRLQTLREKSVAGINFTDALAVVITNEEFRTLTDEQQRELIQAWLYPTNDDGEIDTRSDDEIREQLWNDDDFAEREYETMEDVVREEIAENEEIASDDEADQWFIERAQEFKFHPFVTTCSMCFKREAFYVGITAYGTPFEFCRQCRDQLVQLQIQRTQSPEKFGV